MNQVLNNFFILSLIFRFSEAESHPNPGLVIRVIQKGLDAASEAGVAEINRLVEAGILLPVVTGDFCVIVGQVHYSAFETRIYQTENVHLEAKILEGFGINITLQVGRVRVHGQFEYNGTMMWIPMSNSGTFEFEVSNIVVTAGLNLAMEDNGKVVINIKNCSVSNDEMQITFKGGSEWILNNLNSKILSAIQTKISDDACRTIEEHQDRLMDIMSRYLHICIGTMCALILDLSLTGSPLYGDDYVETTHSGKVTERNPRRASGSASEEVLPVPKPIQRLPNHSKMMTIYLSPYIANTMFEALYRSGQLDLRFSKMDILASLRDPDCSDDSCLVRLFPEISAYSTLELNVSATERPYFEVSGDITTVFVIAEMTLLSGGDSSTSKAVTKYSLKASFSGYPYFENGKIGYHVSDGYLDYSAVDLAGDGNTQGEGVEVGEMLEKIFKQRILPKIRQFGQEGIQLPMYSRIHWDNTSLEWIEDTLVFSSDLVYSSNS